MEEKLVTSILSFSNNVINSLKEKLHHFNHLEIVVCKYFHFGLDQYFVVCESPNSGHLERCLFTKYK